LNLSAWGAVRFRPTGFWWGSIDVADDSSPDTGRHAIIIAILSCMPALSGAVAAAGVGSPACSGDEISLYVR